MAAEEVVMARYERTALARVNGQDISLPEGSEPRQLGLSLQASKSHF